MVNPVQESPSGLLQPRNTRSWMLRRPGQNTDPSNRVKSPDRAANKAASRGKLLGEKNPRFRPGVFYLLDRSSIESEVFFPSKIRDVKLERYSTSMHTFVARSVFCEFFNCRRKNSIPVKCPNPFLLARNLVSANSIESRSGQHSRLLNNRGSKRR
jgi:hypothetical protein